MNVGDIDVGYVRPHCSGFASALVQVPLHVGDEGEQDAFDGTNNDNKMMMMTMKVTMMTMKVTMMTMKMTMMTMKIMMT